MKKINIPILVSSFILSSIFPSCKKYLAEKSNKKQILISSLRDLQSLLDKYDDINRKDPGAPEAVSDNYYVNDADYAAMSADQQRKMYIWNGSDLFPAGSNNDWGRCYDLVYTANTILENINKIKRVPNDQAEWENVKGQALFLRARGFLPAVSVWSLAYDQATAKTDLGIPLKLSTDFNEPSIRSDVEEVYARIISDLKEAISLLPVNAIHPNRSSRPAAYALLARTYLWMRQYDSCFKYADLSLQLKNTLLDYNSPAVVPTATFPIPAFNVEVITDYWIVTPTLLAMSRCKIDSHLYSSYSANDLRKTVFFRNNGNGTYAFKGYYTQISAPFGGLATDEVYLMRAESNARKGNTTEAMNDLNTLLVKRWKTGTFVAFTAMNAQDALSQILVERRKELLMRGLRWMDIKRLNKEGANITLTRKVNGQTYTLPPNDLRYALAIPEDIIAMTGMPQNLR